MCDRWNHKTNGTNIFYLKSNYQKKYCGDKKKLPSGYSRKGTRFECLKSGMFISELKNCNIKTVTKHDLNSLSKKELYVICNQLDVKIKKSRSKNTKEYLIKKIKAKDYKKSKKNRSSHTRKSKIRKSDIKRSRKSSVKRSRKTRGI